MSRLFAVTKSLEEIVTHFAVDMAPAVEVPSETVEGTDLNPSNWTVFG